MKLLIYLLLSTLFGSLSGLRIVFVRGLRVFCTLTARFQRFFNNFKWFNQVGVDSQPSIYSKPITYFLFTQQGFKSRFKFQLNPTRGSSYSLFSAQSRIYTRDGSTVYKHWSADSSMLFGRFLPTEVIKVLIILFIVLLHDDWTLHKVLKEYFN